MDGSRLWEEPGLAPCFVIGVLLPAWFFRRFLGSMPLSAALPAGVVGLFLASFCIAGAELVLTLLTGGEIEELEDGTLLEKLNMCAFLVVWGGIAGFVAAAEAFYLSLPLAWLSVVLLRRACLVPEHERREPLGVRRA
jgi:hypothetical protein